jgi:hypothetical protein
MRNRKCTQHSQWIQESTNVRVEKADTPVRSHQKTWLAFVVLFLMACNLVNQTTPAPTTLAPTLPSPNPIETSSVESVTPTLQDSPDDWGKPLGSLRWQWQLTGMPVDLSIEGDVYDIDLLENDASVVKALHEQGRKVICYVSVGSREDWRPDADQFPASVIGNDYEGWQGENWLDIRQIDLLAPVMRARLDLCRDKGFDSIEPDNIDGYTNDTGFPLTYEDQLKYNLWLAEEAHARGLSIGLKNDADQVADLLPHFDWALTEDCFVEGWCEEMTPFIQAGKPVFAAEYTDTGVTIEQLCQEAKQLNISLILKNRELDAWLQTCP